MKIACLSFTQKGRELGELIVKYASNNLYRFEHIANDEIDGGIKNAMADLIKAYDGLVFISATGIAIRLINPYIIHKTVDPAVVVVDDEGKFAISLLSGHIGGANRLAQQIGDTIGAMPVITTASDNRGIESVDMFAIKNDYWIEDLEGAKKITANMVNGKKIGFYSEMEPVIKYLPIKILNNIEDIDPSLSGAIIVSSYAKLDIPYKNYCRLIPRNINIGVGCRKGVEGSRIVQAIQEVLAQLNLSPKGIKAMGTIEFKKDETGIIKASHYFNCPLHVFTAEEIKKVENRFSKSSFVKEKVGVYSVAEPSAFLLGGKVLTGKITKDGITISVAKEDKDG